MEASNSDPRYMKVVRWIMEGNHPEIERMITQGANLELAVDEHGAKCLHFAAGHRTPRFGTRILHMLIAAGANLNSVTNDGYNSYAGGVRCPAMTQGGIRNTAAMDAVELCQAESLAILVRAGADLSVRNSKGQTALDIAEMEQSDECLDILEAGPPRQPPRAPDSATDYSSAGATPKRGHGAASGGQGGGGRACVGCSEKKAKTEFSKNQWLKGAGTSRCSLCLQQSTPTPPRPAGCPSARRSRSGEKRGRGGRAGAGGRVDGEAGGEAESNSVCCCRCGTNVDGALHCVAACSHTFCCACLLEQATANTLPTVGGSCCCECGQEVRAFTLTGGSREDRPCAMPRRAQEMLQATAAVSCTSGERRRGCNLFSLPSALLGRIWPPERVVVGLRVCRFVHRELPEHAGNMLLVKRAEAVIREDAVARDLQLFRASHLRVALEWRGLPGGLACVVASLGTALTQLDLSKTHLAYEGPERLAGVPQGHFHSLVDNALGRALGGCSALVHLDLGGTRIDDEEAARLAGVLGNCRALAHLVLSKNSIGEQGARRLAGVLAGCKALAHLDLGQNQMGDEAAGRLAGGLRECKLLAHLVLRDNDISDEGAGRLAVLLGGCKALVHLHLGDNEIGAEGAWRLAGVLGECTALAHLDLSYNEIGAEGAARLVGVLRECTALAYLDLGGNNFGAEGARVLEGCKALVYLDFRENGMGDEGAARLVGVLEGCKALAHLDLSINGIGAAGAGRLAGVLRGCKTLTHLDFRENEIGVEGAVRLAGVLGECKTLAYLDLSINQIGAEGAGRLAGVLGECKALAHLGLSYNEIGAEGAWRLAGVLGECKALAYLDLGGNGIGAEGAGWMAGAVEECEALAHLDVSYNEIGDEGAARLVGVLGECKSLAYLDLFENGISAKAAGRFEDGGSDKCRIRLRGPPKGFGDPR